MAPDEADPLDHVRSIPSSGTITRYPADSWNEESNDQGARRCGRHRVVGDATPHPGTSRVRALRRRRARRSRPRESRPSRRRFGVGRTFGDHRALLDSGEVDCVVVAVPHAYHYEIARDSLDAGVGVLVEKPMVLRAAEAWDLVARAETRTCRSSSATRSSSPASRSAPGARSAAARSATCCSSPGSSRRWCSRTTARDPRSTPTSSSSR